MTVSPNFPALNLENGGVAYAQLFGDCPGWSRVEANSSNLTFRENCGAMGLSCSSSSFCVSVAHVVGVRSKEQMIWVHARSVVASMADMEIIWALPAIELIRVPMRTCYGVMREIKHSIASVVFTAKPYPTTRSNTNFSLKSFFFRRCFHDLLHTSSFLHFSWSAGGQLSSPSTIPERRIGRRLP